MGSYRVVDEGDVREGWSAPDSSERAVLRSLNDTREQRRVTRTPNDGGTERYGLELVGGRREDKTLGFCFGVAVVPVMARRVARRFIRIFQGLMTGDHAWCGSVDERQHAALAAGANQVGGAGDVGSVEVGVPASRPYLCGGVEKDVDSIGGFGHCVGIYQIPLILLDTVSCQLRVLSAGKTSDLISPVLERAGYGSPQEAARSSH